MEIAILNKEQKQFLKEYGNHDIKKYFYLTGGSALSAFYLKHRYSEDLDFFSEEKFPEEYVLAFLNEINNSLPIKKVIRTQRFDRRIYVLKFPENELVVEFTYYPFRRLARFKKFLKINVDSIFDIGVNKLMAISDRFDPKDFIDLYFILKEGYDIKRLVEGMKIKMNYEPAIFALQYQILNAKKIETLPKMIRKLDLAQLKRFFEMQSQILTLLIKK